MGAWRAQTREPGWRRPPSDGALGVGERPAGAATLWGGLASEWGRSVVGRRARAGRPSTATTRLFWGGVGADGDVIPSRAPLAEGRLPRTHPPLPRTHPLGPSVGVRPALAVFHFRLPASRRRRLRLQKQVETEDSAQPHPPLGWEVTWERARGAAQHGRRPTAGIVGRKDSACGRDRLYFPATEPMAIWALTAWVPPSEASGSPADFGAP